MTTWPFTATGRSCDFVHAEDAALGRIEDRRAEERAVNAAVRDREDAALQILDLDLPLARFHRVIGEIPLDFGEAFLIGIANDRHDEAALGADGDADVEVMVLNEVIAIDPAIDRGAALERGDGGFDEKRHEAELDAVIFLKVVLHLFAEAP